MSGTPTVEPLRVFYDDACGLCRRLAEYGRSRSDGRLAFVPWQEFAATEEAARRFSDAERSAPPARLRTFSEGRLLEDHEAWSAVLSAYPPFEKFAWIAERLGFLGAVTRVTYYGAQWLHGRCAECP